MPTIAVLPSAVADQIAAGEVVERPSSVVKELVENALDAGATSIDIAIQEGGRKLIRISDDGIGMDADDVKLALERHGTSKIRFAADLAGVRTFGFRGEALPAIASVARVEIDTATSDGVGTSITAAGDSPRQSRDAQRRRGTTVTVRDLFYNAPARAKFMRGARSEWRAISDVITTIAIARIDARIEVVHDERRAFRLPPATSLRSRIAALWGAAYADALVDVDDVGGAVHVSGLAERPADVGTAARRVFVSVNGRAIRDPGLVRAAETAYRSTIPAGTRPSFFIDIVMPATEVDVNVHPAKAEVRFQDRWTVERAVERAFRRALGTFDAAGSFGGSYFRASPPAPAIPVGTEVLAHPSPPAEPLFASVGGNETRATDLRAASETVGEIVPPLFQLRRTYIMFEHAEGAVFIDQHSAHERVLYESLFTAMQSGDVPSQRLLLPFTVTVSAAELEAFESSRAGLEKLGYEIEEFGGHALIVHATPTPHPRFDAERCLRETLAAVTGDRDPAAHARHEKLVATVACKAAVKAGDVLSQSEMRALFIALRDTTLPAHDVHGRSTIVQLPWSEVERRFGRA